MRVNNIQPFDRRDVDLKRRCLRTVSENFPVMCRPPGATGVTKIAASAGNSRPSWTVTFKAEGYAWAQARVASD